MANETEPAFRPCGDSALLVVFSNSFSKGVLKQVTALDRALSAHPLPGIIETVPSFGTLLISYDPCAVRGREVEVHITDLLAHPDEDIAITIRHWEIPVCYDPSVAPDLAELADKSGMAPETFAARHAATAYDVLVTGSFPGYAYCGTLEDVLHFPRRTEPRTTIPAGAAAIANQFTCIYPVASPGGWNLIGQSPVVLFDPYRSPPALLAVGDTISYRAIPLEELQELQAAVLEGRWTLRPTDAA